MHGWLILNKPIGLGSTGAVSAVKRALRAGGYPKVKVGHGGTLDPLASGVLPVALGEATKLAGRMLDSDKVYEFTVRFGEQTSTLDSEGSVIARSNVRPTLAQIDSVLPQFTGPIAQVPPSYSALKVDGQRAYDLARRGEDVNLAERQVTVHHLAVWRMGAGLLEYATFQARVSKGTYIRSLARDIALTLGTFGYVTRLGRTKAGPFGLDGAISLDRLAELGQARALEDALLPLSAGLDDIPALALTAGQAGLLRQGQVLTGTAADDGLCFATLDTVPVALAEVTDGTVRVVRGFNL